MKEAIKRLKEMLNWSDRIGSDEIFEIRQIIKVLEQQNETSQKFYNLEQRLTYKRNKMGIIGISGKKTVGKDLVGKIIVN